MVLYCQTPFGGRGGSTIFLGLVTNVGLVGFLLHIAVYVAWSTLRTLGFLTVLVLSWGALVMVNSGSRFSELRWAPVPVEFPETSRFELRVESLQPVLVYVNTREWHSVPVLSRVSGGNVLTVSIVNGILYYVVLPLYY